MSGLFAVALALVGAVACLNLILTMAVIRRLREIESRHRAEIGADSALPEPGFRPRAFTVTDQDGVTVTEADLADGHHTVVMLSPSCEPCEDLSRRLASEVDALSAGMLVWVVGDAGTQPFAHLAGYRMVHSHTALVDEVFDVRGFPTVLSIVDGVVVEVDHRLRVPVG